MKRLPVWRRWAPAGAAILVLLIVLFAAVATGDDKKSGGAADSTGTATALPTSTSGPPVVIQTDQSTPHTRLTESVSKGSVGDDVKMIQQRLTELGFAPGPIDGEYGGGTEQAVWAFEKLVLQTPRADVTSRVTNDMWQTMQDHLLILPLRPTGASSTHVEIYVQQQVLIVFTDDTPRLIAHISTGMQLPDGKPDHFCENADFNTDSQGVPLAEPVTKYVCADTKTPGGVFKITHTLPGDHIGPLGGMYNPVYFNFGIAIHGAQNVPNEPVSHGCVRINHAISLYFPQLIHVGDTVYVWAQDGKQPEDYTTNESYPSFNQVSIDPDATTTSTSTTTTTISPTSTTAPATTTSQAQPAQSTTTVAVTEPSSPSETTTSVSG
jgi:L,D-transpeptidase catalytic domain/Putative peptidoglycan binding domain